MNTLKILKDEVSSDTPVIKLHPDFKKPAKLAGYLLLAVLVLLWPIMQSIIKGSDETAGYLDPNIWLLVLISLITFMIVIGICWWLLQQFWMSMGLPGLASMVLQFKNLALWLQLGFYWLCFVSLVLAAVGVLTAVL
jgi:hypothetical protein